jgi:hypothetical protein
MHAIAKHVGVGGWGFMDRDAIIDRVDKKKARPNSP